MFLIAKGRVDQKHTTYLVRTKQNLSQPLYRIISRTRQVERIDFEGHQDTQFFNL